MAFVGFKDSHYVLYGAVVRSRRVWMALSLDAKPVSCRISDGDNHGGFQRVYGTFWCSMLRDPLPICCNDLRDRDIYVLREARY
jgi:hypothetical protein